MLQDKNSPKRPRRCEFLYKREYDYYIFCEGEKTEVNYFKGFKNLIEENAIYHDMIKIFPGEGSGMQIVNQAEKYIKKHRIERGKIFLV